MSENFKGENLDEISQNRLFVANKPIGISSNQFLGRLKRKYNVKKAGFSGTLDPFASGVLVVAFGAFTRFFQFLNFEPKVYEATIWLGAKSESGDNENIEKIEILKPFEFEILEGIRREILGEITYTPPKFSAKKIDGVRAYKLARNGENFELSEIKMQIFKSEIISYFHPFLKIKISVSKGAYARSYAEIFAKKLGVNATLSALKRVSEGKFIYENEKPLEILKFLNLKENFYLANSQNIELGKKLEVIDFKIKENGKYLVKTANFHAIIEIAENEVKYLLNRIKF